MPAANSRLSIAADSKGGHERGERCIVGFLVALGGYAYRIGIEERVLAGELGEPYRQCMKRTKRLIPFLV